MNGMINRSEGSLTPLPLKPGEAADHDRLGFILFQLGERFAIQGKWEEAIAEYGRSLQFKPDNALAHESLGLALSRRGRYAEAAAHYRKALDLNPHMKSVQHSLAWILTMIPGGTLRQGTGGAKPAPLAHRGTSCLL